MFLLGDKMRKINGKQNEFEFVKYINNKKISELNLLMIELIENLFDDFDYDDRAYAWLNDKPQKTDFFIKINDTIKRISLKIGDKNSVHVEPISEFIHFLIVNNIERNIVIKYLSYHYADGSTNGSGKRRLSVAEYKIQHQGEIDAINRAFNKDEFIQQVILRFIFKGRNDDNEVDALIYGSTDDFLYLTKEDVYKLIYSRKDIYSSGVHIGPLFIQPLSRNLQGNPKFEKCRYCVQVKWFNLCDHIIEYKNNSLNKL